MSRAARILALLMAGLVGFVAVALGPSLTAAAVARPVITSVGAGAGPVTPTSIVITGSDLTGATAVKFGTKAGVVLRMISPSELEVRTPSGARAGRVSVRVRTAGGWSKVSSSARYTFTARPSIAKLSRTSGVYEGGQKLTITGKNLKTASAVLFGAAEASIVSRSAKKVVVRTPVGVLGATKIVVVTPGGRSKSKKFTYKRPVSLSKKTVAVARGTFVPAAVEWVTGGQDLDTGELQPWVVGLPASADLPAVGQPFLVKPGMAAFRSGLAGTVEDIAVQGDDSVRITVVPADLSDALTRLKVDYQGSLEAVPTNRRAVSAGQALSFPIDQTALLCRDAANRPVVSFSAQLSMTVSDIDVSQHLDLGSLVRQPSYDAAVTVEVKTTGTFTGAFAVSCEVAAAWSNAHRITFFLGATGVTVSVAPAMEFNVNARGTVEVVDRTRTTYAVSAELGQSPNFTRASRTVESTVNGSASFEAGFAAGVSVQFGLLDRAGVEGRALVRIVLAFQADNVNVCATGTLQLNLSVRLFLDLFISRWHSPSLSATIPLRELARACLRAAAEQQPSGEPQITSARLPDAAIGEEYDARLETADNRNGTWTAVRGALPDGLTLDGGSGRVGGIPTGPVGDHPLTVDFTDASGRVATTIIRIQVLPPIGIGGGDIQVTLRWTGAADLDLHVRDPNGEEIYYAHRRSASSGELDHDANAGCNGAVDDDNAVENVFWPPRSAPVGSYVAWVVVYRECDAPLDWNLTVRKNGVVIIDQSGTGASGGFGFTVGRGRALRVGATPVPADAMPRTAKP